MNKLNYGKIKLFGKKIYLFCDMFNVKRPFVVKPDNRFKKLTAQVLHYKHNKTNNSKYIILYNPRQISSLSNWEITYIVLHELGHIKTKSCLNELESEYRAEKFAYNIIYKFFKYKLSWYLKYINNYSNSNRNDIFKKVSIKMQKYIKR